MTCDACGKLRRTDGSDDAHMRENDENCRVHFSSLCEQLPSRVSLSFSLQLSLSFTHSPILYSLM